MAVQVDPAGSVPAPSLSSAEHPTIPLTVEFTGGLELLFSNTRVHTIALPARTGPADGDGDGDGPADVAFLIKYLCDNLRDDPRQEFFVLNDGKTLRPGVLVLINDADWELEGEEAYQLRPGDRITFMSTLHGG